MPRGWSLAVCREEEQVSFLEVRSLGGGVWSEEQQVGGAGVCGGGAKDGQGTRVNLSSEARLVKFLSYGSLSVLY